MLFFNLPRIVKLKGIAKPFSHFIRLGYSPNLASRMSQNTVQAFTVAKLEKYCIEFNCTPNDLFEFRPNPSHPLPADHPLYQLKREDNAEEIITLLHDLPIEKIRELAALVKSESEK
jgi:hypothetical protein